MNNTRRTVIKTTSALGTLVALGLITTQQAHAAVDRAAFEVKSLADAIKAIGGTAATSDQVSVVSPDIAENGAVVPVGVSSTLPSVTMVAILIEKNPNALAASFTLPEGTLANVQTRVKMGQTSNVYALVKSDGKFFMATKEIKVTLGGCGG